MNKLKTLLRAGTPVIGSWLTIPSVFTARQMASLGYFDFFVVDLEHYPISIETASLMMIAVAQAGKVPLARVSW